MKDSIVMSKPARPVKRTIIMLLIVVLILGMVFGWGALRAVFIAKFLKGFANQVQTVATIQAQETPWQPAIQSVGTVTAINGASLSAEVGGIVDTIHFESGQDVQKGDVLLTLRANNDPAVLAQLQAQAKLDEINYARDLKQFAANAVAQSTVDTDRANLAAAQAQVAAQQASMDEKIVRAPFSGRLGIRQVNLGQYLQPGTAIVTLEQLSPLFVDFYLPQQALVALKVGQVVNLKIDAYPGQTFPAKIAAIGATVDSATRSIAVRAVLQNDDLRLRPGMFASVSVETGAPKEAVTLPQTAIAYSSYGDTVYVVKHGQGNALVADQVFVTLGATRGDQVQILDGVKPGDEVVTAGQVKLHNGSPVAVNNTIQPSNDPNPNPPNE
ncbi:efflux RND transporter periplasmic adaptor subunit [Acidocella facilis]|uniref:efflux RND transporter periplasmic adaptor subunit n=1 Tax=Acidocella facilis TaxID=525 RepID=UPI001F434C84|nr:efflux RND transporter periplasmic adaptor subunit [Acidocella facilis]